jgi:cytochrome P450
MGLESLVQMDVHTQAFFEQPNAFISRGGQRLPYVNGRSGPEFLTYNAVEAIFRDQKVRPKTAEVFVNMGLSRTSPIYDFLQYGNFNMMPRVDHDRIRPIIMKGFRPQRIGEATPLIRAIARELTDELLKKNECDVVADFSHHLSIRTIAAFIGVPAEDIQYFQDATVEFILFSTVPFLPGVPRLEKAMERVFGYLNGLLEKRRAMPQGDFVSDLIALQSDGQLSKDELLWCIVFMLLAGHDTTRFQIASTIRAIINAGLWEKIAAEPALATPALKEAHRMYPAGWRFNRVVLEPVEVDGLPFKEGDIITVNLVAAGRDPARFADPDTFDLARAGKGYDVAFGHGAHHCVGWALATAEIRESVQELTQRLTDVSLTGAMEYGIGGTIAGPEHLKMRYRARG